MYQRTTIFALPVLCGLSAFAFGLAPTASEAATVVVNPTTMASTGWAFDNRDGDGAIIASTGALVNGPATPPLGTGSANLNTPSGAGDTTSELRNTAYVGTALESITALNYSTYTAAWNGQQVPFLVLYLSSGNRLWFEPTYSSNSQPAVTTGAWQSWNALAGLWYDDNGSGGSGPSVDTAITWSAMVAANAGTTIVNQSGNGLGGIRFGVGYASPEDNFNSNIDAFTVGINGVNTTYDFELAAAAATPLPAALPLFGTGLGVMGFLGWRKKRKSASKSAKAA